MHNDTIRTETTLYYDRCMTSTDDKVIIFQRIGPQKKKSFQSEISFLKDYP